LFQGVVKDDRKDSLNQLNAPTGGILACVNRAPDASIHGHPLQALRYPAKTVKTLPAGCHLESNLQARTQAPLLPLRRHVNSDFIFGALNFPARRFHKHAQFKRRN
jgi:hypothetical protein